jgi:hypothetical protein
MDVIPCDLEDCVGVAVGLGCRSTRRAALAAGVRHRQMPITVASERRHREEPTYLSFT